MREALSIQLHRLSLDQLQPEWPQVEEHPGAQAASLTDFGYYSEALKNSGIVWSEEKLDEFLSAPTTLVPGTVMSIVSVKDAKERREIIAFVKKQDSSVDFCF